MRVRIIKVKIDIVNFLKNEQKKNIEKLTIYQDGQSAFSKHREKLKKIPVDEKFKGGSNGAKISG
jgi:hypothetical protein